MSPEPDRNTGVGLTLEIDGTRIDVATDDAADHVWLAEFLAPAFVARAQDAVPADWRVRLTVSADRYAELCATLDRAPRDEIEGLGYDGSFSSHRCLSDEQGRTWAHDEHWFLFFGVDAAAGSVRVIACHRDDHARLGLMRVVRELATGALSSRGRLPVHCAAFEMDGKAVLICGPKHAGKTSLLVHALQSGGTFLSNDRVFVDTAGPPLAQPMPTIVMLREGTLDHHARLAAAFREARFDRSLTLAECAPGVPRPEPRVPASRKPLGISPAQLCRLTGAPMRGRTPVGLLLFPTIDPAVKGLVIEPLDPRTARSLMERSLMKPSHPTRHSPLFAPQLSGSPIDPGLETDRCRRLVEAVPARTCRLGPDAYRGNLLEALRRSEALCGNDARQASAD
jgi:hypothetical protein